MPVRSAVARRIVMVALVSAVVAGACDSPRPSLPPGGTGEPTVAPTASIAASATSIPTAGPTPGGPSAAPFDVPEELSRKVWSAEGPDGWRVGQLGGPTIDLKAGEIPIAIDERWIVSAFLADPTNVLLLVRRFEAPDPVDIEIGPRIPGSAAIVGDVVFLGGLSSVDDRDPGVLPVDLVERTVGKPIARTEQDGGRYVIARTDGTLIVSTICPQDDSYTGTCDADLIDPKTMERIGGIDKVRGGIPRAFGGNYVVLTEQTDSMPSNVFFAGVGTDRAVDPETDREYLDGYVTSDGILVQAMLEVGDAPLFSIETVDLAGEDARPRAIFQEAAEDRLPGLWAELSSDRFAVIGPWSDVDLALGRSDFQPVAARVLDLRSGEIVTDNLLVGPTQ
jgi:hypothetical protein